MNEAFADGVCSQHELTNARLEAYRGKVDRIERIDGRCVEHVSAVIYRATGLNAKTLELAVWSFQVCVKAGKITPILGDLLRDIFGNPFRPVVVDPSWRTSDVLALADGMYESRDFSPMPILSDALQDAGCNSDDILTHCRDANGVHVRGCWVVDLVLGKE